MSTSARIPAYKFPKRAYAFYLVTTVLVAASLEGIIYLTLLGNTQGPFSFFHREAAPDPAMTRETRVALLISESSANFHSDNPFGFSLVEREWMDRILRPAGIPYRQISDQDLAKGLGDANVLILPESACLDDAQRNTIREFLAAGKGVIASGPVGARNGNCEWKGWDFLTALTGARSASIMTPDNTMNVCFRGQQFFSRSIPAGYKLEIPSQELTVLDARSPDAFLSDWALRPPNRGPVSSATLALHHVVGRGRVVWFGFHDVLPFERVTDQARVDSYLKSAVQWVAKQPLAILGDWPKQQRSAALIAVENDRNYANSERLAGLFKSEGVPAIFLCDSTDAAKQPRLVKDFESAGEVASLGDTEEPLANQLLRVQADRLHTAKLNLDKLSHGDAVGFASPQGITNDVTIEALNDAGYRYELNEMAVTRDVPEIVDYRRSFFFPFQKAEVMKIFHTSVDDFETLANYRGPDPPGPDLADLFLSDFRRNDYLGGVYTFYIHSDIFGSPQYLGTVRTVVDNLRRSPVWITTGRELTRWWSSRAQLEIQTSKLSIHRIRFDVANKGQSDVMNESAYLYLPYHPKKIQVSAAIFRLSSPTFQLLDDDILRIDLPKLSAQTNYTYVVKLDE